LACSTISSIAILTHAPSPRKLYLTTVQPHLKYASSVWDPYPIEAIKSLD